MRANSVMLLEKEFKEMPEEQQITYLWVSTKLTKDQFETVLNWYYENKKEFEDDCTSP